MSEALESVLAQTWPEWDLLCWDDCSTDRSRQVIERYVSDRVRYVLSPEDTPLGRARQLAIEQADGDWLAFLDQDDVWTPRKLELQMALADDPRVALIYGRTVAFDERGRTREYDHRHEFTPLPEGDIFERLFVDSCFIAMSSVLLRRSAVMELGPIPPEITVCPDYHLYLGVARSHRARAVEQVVCRYRVHSDSMTRRTVGRIHDEVLLLIDRWESDLGPSLTAHRRRVHHTVAAYEQMSNLQSLGSGIRRLLRHGSVPYLLSRPFARAFRAVRRRIQTPRWKRFGPAASAPAQDGRVTVLSTLVNADSFQGTLAALESMVARRVAGYVSCANVYSVMLAIDDPGYREVQNGAARVTTDGMPIVWALRLLGHPSERVHNDDLFLAACRAHPEWRHFLVGGRVGQPEEVAAALRRLCPGVEIVGTAATPQRPVPPLETEDIVERIRQSRADLVWVGMGTPAQDFWMRLASARVGAPMIGVGSSFDMLTGRTRPTPAWMKKSGLQWLFRLAQEPRRLAFRYFHYNPRFAWAFAGQMVRRLTGRIEEQPASDNDRSAIAETETGGDELDLSVIIVSYNVERLLADCLHSVARELEGVRHEVFVVDSASSDGTVALVREAFPSVRLIVSAENIGFSAGNNLALPHCRGRKVVLLNPDTIVHPGGLRRLMESLDADRRLGAAGPRLLLADGSIQPESARRLPTAANLICWLFLLDKLEWKLRFGGGSRHSVRNPPDATLFDQFYLWSWKRDVSCEVDSISGACVMLRRDVLAEIGTLDEASPLYLDDIDLCRRIRNAGWRIRYCEDARVSHLWQKSSSQLRREADLYELVCHSTWLYLRKHEGRASALLFAATAAVAGVIRVAASMLALPFMPDSTRQACRRQIAMSAALLRWGTRIPKSPPRFGFACEEPAARRVPPAGATTEARS